MPTEKERTTIIERARKEWVTDDLQIDTDVAKISSSMDGYWVQAWVFIRKEED